MTLGEAALEWRRCAALTADAKQELIKAVIEALAAGASEYQVADQVGVQRLTIRSWIGK